MGYVIDASVAFKLIVTEPDSPQAHRLAVRASILVAPDLLLIEMANALWRYARKPDLEKEEIRAARQLPLHNERVDNAKNALAELISGHQIDFVEADKLALKALALALELGHPIYDCTYLALALAEKLPFVTADTRFLRVAQQSAYADHVIDLNAASET